ncbi:MAG: hypothetical protein ABIQ99_12270, partial [Thermoflexales bacterium]
ITLPALRAGSVISPASFQLVSALYNATVRDYKTHLVNGGRVERDGPRVRMIIPPVAAEAYADAQIDDYEHELPRRFANAPPLRLSVRARFSHNRDALKGTAGFGFWNHPFSREGAVVDPPRNVWFFHGSPESDLEVARSMPGHGFKAAMLNTPPIPFGAGGTPNVFSRLASAAANLALRARPLARLAMAAGRLVVNAREQMLDSAVPDLRHWHTYSLDWRPNAAVFTVDGTEILRAHRPPAGPLGFVAWVDNYRVTAAGGRYDWGYVASSEPQWLELEFLE